MAGYDFTIPVPPSDRAFAKLLLRHLQKMAGARPCQRPTQVVFRWRRPTRETHYHHYYVTVDGDFAELQGLAVDAIPALQHFGAGVKVAHGANSRSMLPEVVPIALYKATVEMQDNFDDLNRQVMEAGLPGVLINSYLFGLTGIADVDQNLLALSSVLLTWRNRIVAAETVLEQVHTVLELLLKIMLGAPNRGWSFTQLVNAAVRTNRVRRNEGDQLERMKNMRRDAKHRAQRVPEDALSDVMPYCVGIIHRFVAELKRREQQGAA